MTDQNQQDQVPDTNEPFDPDDSSVGTATKEIIQEKPADRKPGLLPPFKVLLHNDEVNDVEHVIKTITLLTTLSPEEATHRTLEAHFSGVALLLVTHKERAELYQEQFASASLTVTIEPDSA